MRILYLAHRIPYPPNKGEKTRSFHQIEFLSARHIIDLFCFADSDKEAEGKVALQSFCRNVHVETLHPREGYLRASAGLFTDMPASIAYYRSASMYEAVQRALLKEAYDLIFVYCSSMAQFVPRPAPIPTVVDFVDADSSKWKQYAKHSSFPKSWLYEREGRTLSQYEKDVADTCTLSLVTTPQEVFDLGGGVCQAVEVIENGVTAPNLEATQTPPVEIRALQPYAVFVGTMNYRPNVDAVIHFAEEILPLLRQSHSHLRFLIVGRDPAPGVRRLARLPGVIVTGSVPDVHRYVAGAEVVVAPFRIAQGVQNKVLEALVAGIPVVLTSRPARAIGSEARETLLVADTPIEFANAVRSVLDNPEVRRRSREAAPKLKDMLTWTTSLHRLEDLLGTAVARQRESRLVDANHT